MAKMNAKNHIIIHGPHALTSERLETHRAQLWGMSMCIGSISTGNWAIDQWVYIACSTALRPHNYMLRDLIWSTRPSLRIKRLAISIKQSRERINGYVNNIFAWRNIIYATGPLWDHKKGMHRLRSSSTDDYQVYPPQWTGANPHYRTAYM